MKQELLRKIVKSWHIKNKPEFRRFRCGNCGRILHKAWHNWLNYGNFKTPVHLCKKCQVNLKIKPVSKKPDKPKVRLNAADWLMKKIINSWKINEKIIYKTFACDKCEKNIHKAYHIWANLNNKLSEIHFCRKCAVF